VVTIQILFLSLLLRDVSETALNLLSTYFVCRFLSQKREEGKAIIRGDDNIDNNFNGVKES
jgi:hypothetical protein